MGFQRKADRIAALKPDIAVIPECGEIAASAFETYGYSSIWVGSNSTKGLAVFVRHPLHVRLVSRPEQKIIAMLDIEGHKRPLKLIAVWACKVGSEKCDNYIGQVCKAFRANPSWFAHANTVVAGDFNSNSAWDWARPTGNHTTVVEILQKHKIVSAYHKFYRQKHGEETRNTFYFHKDLQNPFHIDYVYLPSLWARRLKRVSIGTHARWAALSDHRPLVVDF